MFRSFLALALTLSIYSVASADDSLKLITPTGSDLHATGVSYAPLLEAKFDGQIWVSGTFRAQWPADIKTPHPYDQVEVGIRLDKGEADKLPHFERYTPDTIGVVNREDAIRSVFGKELAAQILGEHVQFAKIHGRFLIKDYSVGVECDLPWARGTVISADVQQAAKLSTKTDLDDC